VIAFYATSLCRSIARELLYAVEDASRQMKIVMMATGGVGCYYGAKLAAANEDVHFIARGAQLAAVAESQNRSDFCVRGRMANAAPRLQGL
jgi:hypothetical protein